ncbi:CPXCG motif-containing cysteine-rich protein [Thalassotalea aquiviva]|uniref:CPXCG motif-containing cysteine-rich protein n=1 Tax=Thalassotalea aquiviva TaxID=3242415 RepID=UPI00352B29C8
MPQVVSRKTIECPHCGHHLHVTLDTSQGDQNYYESCPACCNDIHMTVSIDDYHQKIRLMVDADDEQYF